MLSVQYAPKSLSHVASIRFHTQTYEFIHRFTKTPELWNGAPHFLLVGPKGSGKHTFLRLWILQWLNIQNDAIKLVTISKHDTKLSTDVQVISSPYHLELAPKSASPAEQNLLIQFFIKTYSQQFQLHLTVSQKVSKPRPKYRLIVLHHIDQWSITAQHALRRIMEQNYKTIRFIFTSDTYTLVSMPLRSRCLPIHFHRVEAAPLKSWLLTSIFPRLNFKSSGNLIDMKTQGAEVEQVLDRIIQQENHQLWRCLLRLQSWFYQRMAGIESGPVTGSGPPRFHHQCLELWNTRILPLWKLKFGIEVGPATVLEKHAILLKHSQLWPQIHHLILAFIQKGWNCHDIWLQWMQFLESKCDEFIQEFGKNETTGNFLSILNQETQMFQLYNPHREKIHETPRLQNAILQSIV